MEVFNRERQLYSLAISPQVVPMMYFCEVRCAAAAQYGRQYSCADEWAVLCLSVPPNIAWALPPTCFLCLSACAAGGQ